MTRDVHATAARGYGKAADAYARARPSYPTAAVDWLLAQLGNPSNVVEIGAGTGKFTAQLAERGITVLAVEPVAAMRERLAQLGPLVTPMDARAEELPLEARSVSGLIASQSLHWANVAAGLTEFDRVLDVAGAVGLIWNFRDLDYEWQRALDALLTELRGDAPHSRDGRWERAVAASAFEISGSATWRWSLTTDKAGVLDRVRSVSYVAELPEEEQCRIDGRVVDILREHRLSSSSGIEFPYLTEAHVLRRRSS